MSARVHNLLSQRNEEVQKSNYIPETPLGQGENAGGEREDGLENQAENGDPAAVLTAAIQQHGIGTPTASVAPIGATANAGGTPGNAGGGPAPMTMPRSALTRVAVNQGPGATSAEQEKQDLDWQKLNSNTGKFQEEARHRQELHVFICK